MRRPYVDARGRLSHQPPLLPTFSKRRALFLISSLILLVLTNPTNETRSLLPDYLWKKVKRNQRNTSRFNRWLLSSKPKTTNYVIFSFTKESDLITATGMLHTWNLCSTVAENPLTQSVCTWIGDTFCHGKPVLDANDLPYTLTRILSITILTSMLLSFCTIRPISFRSSTHPYLVQVLSIFEQPSWYDLVRVNACVYPALTSMQLMVQTMVYDTWTVRLYMVFGFIILLFGIGVMGNTLASSIMGGRVVTGFDASIGACLSYHRTIAGSPLLFFRSDSTAYLSSIHYFWFTIVTYLFDNRIGPLVAFVTGSMMGHGFGLLQREIIAETIHVRIEVGLKRFFDKWLVMG